MEYYSHRFFQPPLDPPVVIFANNELVQILEAEKNRTEAYRLSRELIDDTWALLRELPVRPAYYGSLVVQGRPLKDSCTFRDMAFCGLVPEGCGDGMPYVRVSIIRFRQNF